jgi:hypothetical protein
VAAPLRSLFAATEAHRARSLNEQAVDRAEKENMMKRNFASVIAVSAVALCFAGAGGAFAQAAGSGTSSGTPTMGGASPQGTPMPSATEPASVPGSTLTTPTQTPYTNNRMNSCGAPGAMNATSTGATGVVNGTQTSSTGVNGGASASQMKCAPSLNPPPSTSYPQ